MNQSLLDKARLVSFDIFDTLLCRQLFSPFDVFDYVAYLNKKRGGMYLRRFRELRIYAEETARAERLVTHGHQDVTLLEIYEFLAPLYSLSDTEVRTLIDLEQDVELRCCRARNLGWTMFSKAAAQNKEIILTSDMYLSRDCILNLLSKAGYAGFVDLFVSSEHRVRKKEGDLFSLVLSTTHAQPSEILHIGDNPVGDLAVPKRLGIATHRVTRAVESMSEQSENWGKVVALAKISRTLSESLILGLIANRLFDSSETSLKKNTDYGGDPYVFGYSSLGPLVCGFAAWVRNRARLDGVEHLIFLSRDGRIVKDVYMLLYPEDKPLVSYFYLSRRAVSFAQIRTDADLVSICLQPVYSMTIADYLLNRFCISPDRVDVSVLQRFGVSGTDFKIGAKFDKRLLAGIVLGHRAAIFERSTLERNALLKAFRNLGGEGLNSAVIDIGYAGTLQDGLMNLTGQMLRGYYLSTFSTASKSLLANPLAHGYLADLEHPSSTNAGIYTHRFVYETLFCDAAPSFMYYEQRSVGVTPVFNETHDDSNRSSLVLQAHAGARVLAEDIREASMDALDGFALSPDFASRMLDLFMRKPHPIDAAMFQGVTFEDANGPSTGRYLVPPRNQALKMEEANRAIWKEAAKAFRLLIINEEKREHSPIRLPKNRKVRAWRLRIEESVFRNFLSEKLFHKYLRNRNQFFIDSTKTALRLYFKTFG
jgi:FMN phosphatase YigB (HAD superfamily)